MPKWGESGSEIMPKTRKSKPWNKGKMVGKKPALTPEEVQAIRVVLGKQFPIRDQLMFAIAIDSCLRGCDLVRLMVSDVCLAGAPRDVVRVQPTKTAESSGAIIAFELQPDTRRLLEAHVEAERLGAADQLFVRLQRTHARKGLSERAYANAVKRWVGAIGLNPVLYGTHSIRRSRPAYIYQQTANLRVCQLMLGHTSITVTQEYLGIEEAETLETSRRYRM